MGGEGRVRKKAHITGEDKEEDECACKDGVSSCILPYSPGERPSQQQHIVPLLPGFCEKLRDTLTRKRVTDSHGENELASEIPLAVRDGSGVAGDGLESA